MPRLPALRRSTAGGVQSIVSALLFSRNHKTIPTIDSPPFFRYLPSHAFPRRAMLTSPHLRRCNSTAGPGTAPGAPVVGSITVQEVAELLDAAAVDASVLNTYQLIDVREPWEAELASLPSFTLLPLSAFEEWAPQIVQGTLLDKSKGTLVLCHHGIRSAHAARFLVESAGFTDVRNISGGIDAYSRRVDGAVPPRY